jgi:hypothetical protein
MCLILSLADMVHDVRIMNFEMVRTEECVNVYFFAEEVVNFSADRVGEIILMSEKLVNSHVKCLQAEPSIGRKGWRCDIIQISPVSLSIQQACSVAYLHSQ